MRQVHAFLQQVIKVKVLLTTMHITNYLQVKEISAVVKQGSYAEELFLLLIPQDTWILRFSVGSITSCCSGNEPALLPQRHSWTREVSFVSLNQSHNRPQIVVGHKLSRQFGLRPVMADNVELINGIRENFRDN